MKHRFLLSAALIILTPFAASAQFTSVITPPRKEAPAAVVTPEVRARNDSVHKATLTDMKEWVDSAATALTARSTTTRTDTVARTPVSAPVTTPAESHARHGAVTNRDSAPLPDTATPIPAVALVGFGMVVAGLFLMRKRDA